ncbi:MAG TPA: DNA gyrase inhibitor YacG [Gammaproteobacteria bacterium]|nr:DNA gyrase inhibitor YacG [Gammaproteobacteria bacterium]
MDENLESSAAVKCPHCGAAVQWTAESKYKPFCSERCRLIDLGDWLLEKNAIPDNRLPENQDDADP